LALRGVSLFFLKRKLQRRASRRAKYRAQDAKGTNSTAQGARLRERILKRKAQGANREAEMSQSNTTRGADITRSAIPAKRRT
jgi:hypothetical protein